VTAQRVREQTGVGTGHAPAFGRRAAEAKGAAPAAEGFRWRGPRGESVARQVARQRVGVAAKGARTWMPWLYNVASPALAQ
jgi:hypothetical protein